MGRQTQTRMRCNFEEEKFSSHACLCLSPQGATAPLAAFLGPRQKIRSLRYRGRAKQEIVSITPHSLWIGKNKKLLVLPPISRRLMLK